MRLLVMADIHGNLPALEAVLEDVEPEQFDGVLVAGDLVIGVQPAETIRLIQSLGATVIRGNHENYLLRYHHGTAPETWDTCQQWASMRWNYHQLDQELLAYLRDLPEQQVIQMPGTSAILMVHGSPRNPAEYLNPDHEPESVQVIAADLQESIMVCGHSHVPWVRRHGHRVLLNPGAVSNPLNGHVGAQYAVLTWTHQQWQVEHRAIPYDLDRLRKIFRQTGFLDYGGALARAFWATITTGQDVCLTFLHYAQRLAAEAGYADHSVVPDDIWERAAVRFDWQQYEC